VAGNGTWNGPLDVGMGQLGSPPPAAGWNIEADVFWRGTDANLWEGWQDSGSWNGPARIGMGPIPLG
jgi:hypothetical protein